MARSDKCYLVEGYTDVLSMNQAGIENVVASSGTALTADQIRLVKRFTPNITIIYPHPNDTFGISAPTYTVIIKDEHLHLMWYSFNESNVKIFFTINSTINQNEWYKLSNGTYKLIFYANDSAGNLNFVEIIIRKISYEDGNYGNLTIIILSLFFFIGFLTIGIIAYTYLIIKRIKIKKL